MDIASIFSEAIQSGLCKSEETKEDLATILASIGKEQEEEAKQILGEVEELLQENTKYLSILDEINDLAQSPNNEETKLDNLFE